LPVLRRFEKRFRPAPQVVSTAPLLDWVAACRSLLRVSFGYAAVTRIIAVKR